MEALPQCIHFSQVLPTLLLLDGYSDEEAKQQVAASTEVSCIISCPRAISHDSPCHSSSGLHLCHTLEPGAPLYRDALGAQGQ